MSGVARLHGRGGLLAAVVAAFVTGAVWAGPKVEVFTPQGQAKGVRQVAVRFTEPMVAFGDPRLAEPFTVRCEGDLPAGQRCRFTVRPDFKSVGGQAIEGQREFNFDTGGPAVLASLPRQGNQRIDEEQVFLLALDGPVDPASLSDAWCEAVGINERIPLKLLSDKDTSDTLAAVRSQVYNLFYVYLKGRRRLPIANFKIEDKRFRGLPIIGVQCARRFPAGAQIGLVLGANVKSKTGLARQVPQRLAFRVRPEFSVKFTCERVNRDAACLPVGPMVLEFNAPVPRETAERIRLKGERGDTYEPAIKPNVKTVDSVTFKGPFPEKARFTVDLPSDFRDDAGREAENKSSFPLGTATDESPPLAKFPGRFGILELNADPMLPVTVRGIEAALSGRRAELL